MVCFGLLIVRDSALFGDDVDPVILDGERRNGWLLITR